MVFLLAIGIFTFVCICVLALWLKWEMGKAKRALDDIRSMHAKKEITKTKKFWYLSWYIRRRKVAPQQSDSTPKKTSDSTPKKTIDLNRSETGYLKQKIEKYKQDKKDEMKRSWYLCGLGNKGTESVIETQPPRAHHNRVRQDEATVREGRGRRILS